MKKVLVLYMELAGYVVEGFNHLCEKYDIKLDIVSYPVNSDAPFVFAFSEKITLYEREKLDRRKLIQLAQQGNYDCILCGGWADKDYLATVKACSRTTSILGFDTPWKGNAKQYLAALYARMMILPHFNYAWVPGERQTQLARRIGFSEKNILTGIYSCDTKKFSALYPLRKQADIKPPKKLIYTGRYAEVKFIRQLWQTVKELRSEGYTEWELHCAGTGPLWNECIESEGIYHHGFMQPHELYEFMKTGDAFVLPSTFEPWGVVVHEFACAGYPMVLSDSIGSSEVFLENGQNGFLFRAGDVKDLKEKLKQLLICEGEQLKSMGERSSQRSKKITLDTWADTLYSIL